MTSKVLLAGGCVLTLGARTPNHQQADVLIDGEVIAEVGTHLRARDAEQIDSTGTIVMPGFIHAGCGDSGRRRSRGRGFSRELFTPGQAKSRLKRIAARPPPQNLCQTCRALARKIVNRLL